MIYALFSALPRRSGHARRSRPTLVSVVLLALLMVSCGGGSGNTGSSPPVILPPPPVPPGTGGVNDPDKLAFPYVILVSFDGFRADYQDNFATPAMDRLATEGVRADGLVPVFPTVTFPNHYSIATGLYPANHGIVANSFPSRDRQRWYRLSDPQTVGDGSWYGGEPIWVAAEKNGLVTAAFFFVGTEAEINGVRPTFWRTFDSSIPGQNRVMQVLDWLNLPSESRPHLITLYFEDVDAAGHQFGPEAAQTGAAITQVDQYLGQLLDGIESLPFAQDIYTILVSDHGMDSYPGGSDVFVLSDVISLDGISEVGGGNYLFLFFDQSDDVRATQIRDDINAVWANGRAWLPAEAPQSWAVSSDSRFPDVIVQANNNFRVVAQSADITRIPVGLHGWAPEFEKMHGIFLAKGPRIATNSRISPINSIDIYPLMMEILQIPLVEPIDGDPAVLGNLLQ